MSNQTEQGPLTPTWEEDELGLCARYNGVAPWWEVQQGSTVRPIVHGFEPGDFPLPRRPLVLPEVRLFPLHSWNRTALRVRETDALLGIPHLGQRFPRPDPHRIPLDVLMGDSCVLRVHNKRWISERVCLVREALGLSLAQLILPFESQGCPQVVVSVTSSWLSVVLAVDLSYLARIASSPAHHSPADYCAIIDALDQPGYLSRFEGTPLRLSRSWRWYPAIKRSYTFHAFISPPARGSVRTSLVSGTGCGDYTCWYWAVDTCQFLPTLPLRLHSATPVPDILYALDGDIMGIDSTPGPSRQTAPSISWSQVPWVDIPSDVPIIITPLELGPITLDHTFRRSQPGDPFITFDGNAALLFDRWEEARSRCVLAATSIPQPPDLLLSSIHELEWAMVRVSISIGSVTRFVPLVSLLRDWSFQQIVAPYSIRARGGFTISVTAPGLALLIIFRMTNSITPAVPGVERVCVSPTRRIFHPTSLSTRGFLSWVTRGMQVISSSPVCYQSQQGTVLRLIIHPALGNHNDLEILSYDPMDPRCRPYASFPVPVHQVTDISLVEYVAISGC